MRISQYLFDQLIPPFGFSVDHSVEKAVAFGVFNPMNQIALFLMAKRLSVTDKEFEITRIGLVGRRVVNLIYDTVTEGKPEATAFGTSGSQTIL